MMGDRERNLSKSKVMKGLQCPKSLYLSVHAPELARPTPAAVQAVFDEGHRVGIEARNRFPGGVLIDVAPTEFATALEATQAQIAAGARVLYEATFVHEGVLVRIDILHRSRAGSPWHICEVKSTTEVKDQHIDDAAVQTWVLRGSGERVASVSIMHINNECVYPELDRLFTQVDVTAPVEEALGALPSAVAKFKAMLMKQAAPNVDIGPHCDDPYECEFKDHCWSEKKIPEISVFDIPNLSTKRKWEFYRKGVVDLAQLRDTEEKLNSTQRKMIEVTLSGTRALDRKAVQRELRAWTFPLYFLDFETIGPAIPRYPGTRPYEQVPFQFSCHIQLKPGSGLTHSEYLHDLTSDPREPLIRALIDCIAENSSVVAYNKGFESGRLSALARAFPVYGDRLLGIAGRLVDPLPIFRAHVYDRKFRGSFSIKSVAPALLGASLSYEGMAVAGGSEAQIAFEELILDATSPARKAELRQAMLDYCRKDTIAMVKLVEWLRDGGGAGSGE
ncbi:MAG: DUF2779 domain-containing protein [Deltaproteobacteria bacterium]|nr:DUF2779 domain-containing protein [Deltaproteobacteria bacterium]